MIQFHNYFLNGFKFQIIGNFLFGIQKRSKIEGLDVSYPTDVWVYNWPDKVFWTEFRKFFQALLKTIGKTEFKSGDMFSRLDSLSPSTGQVDSELHYVGEAYSSIIERLMRDNYILYFRVNSFTANCGISTFELANLVGFSKPNPDELIQAIETLYITMFARTLLVGSDNTMGTTAQFIQQFWNKETQYSYPWRFNKPVEHLSYAGKNPPHEIVTYEKQMKMRVLPYESMAGEVSSGMRMDLESLVFDAAYSDSEAIRRFRNIEASFMKGKNHGDFYG